MGRVGYLVAHGCPLCDHWCSLIVYYLLGAIAILTGLTVVVMLFSYQGTLPFLELGTTVGVERMSVPTQTGLSTVVNISTGYTFGNSTQTSVYVCNFYSALCVTVCNCIILTVTSQTQ